MQEGKGQGQQPWKRETEDNQTDNEGGMRGRVQAGRAGKDEPDNGARTGRARGQGRAGQGQAGPTRGRGHAGRGVEDGKERGETGGERRTMIDGDGWSRDDKMARVKRVGRRKSA